MNQHRSCENAGQAFDPLGIIMAIGMNWMNIELNKTSLKPPGFLRTITPSLISWGVWEIPGIWSWGGELPKESFQRLRQQARGRAEGLKGLKGLIGKWDKMSRNPVGSWSWICICQSLGSEFRVWSSKTRRAKFFLRTLPTSSWGLEAPASEFSLSPAGSYPVSPSVSGNGLPEVKFGTYHGKDI